MRSEERESRRILAAHSGLDFVLVESHRPLGFGDGYAVTAHVGQAVDSQAALKQDPGFQSRPRRNTRTSNLKVTVDFSPVVRGSAGIGKYVTGLIGSFVELGDPDRLTLFLPRRGRSGLDSRYALLPAVENFLPERVWRGWSWATRRAGMGLDGMVGAPDLFHATDNVFPGLKRARTVFTLYDLVIVRHPETVSPMNRAYLRAILSLALRDADRIIAISEFTKQEAIEIYGTSSERIVVIPLGVHDDFAPASDAAMASVRERYALPGPYLLTVGTIEPRKNLPTLFRALRALERMEHRLVVVGAPGWKRSMALAELDLVRAGDRVRFLGRVPEADLPALYSAASLLLFPSLYEGFGIPVLEAMACGTPVVCSNSASLPEVGGDAVHLVPPTDADAWAGAIERLLGDDRERSDLRARGLRRAACFRWSATARKTLNVYREVHAGRP